ncbi:nucleotide exchange factor GrpE [bacterium]|jgi:grpE|nr:nucleotide exchange factor GrpE [bacterium]
MNTEEKEIKKDDACCNDECKCGCHNDKNEECKCHDENHKKHKHKENHELEEANKKIMELQEKLMYSQADSINYRKRKDEEVANMLKYANQDLLLDMVNMIENMDRAASVKAESEESKKIQDGIKMVSNQFKDILKKYGVVEIEALGYPFDENYMEAMMIGHDTTKPNEMVLEVLMKGYKYKDRILKHAVVKVNQIEENENEKGND